MACLAYTALSITPGAIASSCEIRGSAGSDLLVGTPHRDVICGRDGSDVIKGGAGKDKLLGGGGADRLVGGRKSDVIKGGNGPDRLSGLGGADSLFGNPADDHLRGGAGRDTLDGGPGADQCVGGGGVDEFRGCQDLTPPVLEDVSVLPHTVDSSQGDAEVTVTVSAHDDISGLSEIQLDFAGGDRWLGLRLGGGTPSKTLKIPQYSPRGTYDLVSVWLIDGAGNDEWVPRDELLARGIDVSFDQVGEGDTTPPTLTDFSFTPAEIDTSASDQTIDFTLGASDNVAGTKGCTIVVRYPNGAWAGYGTQQHADDPQNVVMSRHVPIARYAPPGTYHITEIKISDTAGNGQSYTESEIAAGGFPTTFEQTAAGDTTPPILAGFTISPDIVHTDAGLAEIRFEAHVTDDLAGLGDPPLGGFDDIWIDPPVRPNGSPPPLWGSSYRGRTGSSTDAVYQYESGLARYSAFGTYRVPFVSVTDRVGNESRYTGDDLVAAGFDSSFENEPTR